MIALPKPRGFWDYALFALIMTGLLVFLFWLDARDGLRWADAVLAFATAVLFVVAVIVARRREKAKWIAKPTWHVPLVANLGTFVLLFGAMYADSYFFHREDIPSSRLRHDIVLAIVLSASMTWTSRIRWRHRGRQLS